MRRQRIKITGLMLTFAVLAAAALFLKMPPQAGQPGEDADGQETNQRDTLLWSGEGAEEGTDINEIDVEIGGKAAKEAARSAGGSYRIVRREKGYVIADFPEDRLDGGRLEDALNALMRAEVSEDLGEQADLEQFGLGAEGVRFAVSGSDGTVRQFQIGNMLPGSADRSYALTDGSVCVVDGFPQSLCVGRKAFYKLLVVAVPKKNGEEQANRNGNDGGETPYGNRENGQEENREAAYALEYLNISGSRFDDDGQIRIVQSKEADSGYLMESPAYGAAMLAETDVSVQTVFIPDSLARVEASSVAYESAGEEELRECGLSQPYAVVEYGMNGEKHTLRVSAVKDGMRFLMADEDPAVYTVEDSRVSAWAQVKAEELRTSYLWLVDVGGLDRLVLEGERGRHEYRLERSKEDSGSGFRVYYGDKELDAEGAWLPFYRQLLGMPILSTDMPPDWEEEPAYTVSYCYSGQSGRAPVTVTFHREHGRGRYAALLDGRFAGVLRADTVEEAMESADRVNAYGESH